MPTTISELVGVDRLRPTPSSILIIHYNFLNVNSFLTNFYANVSESTMKKSTETAVPSLEVAKLVFWMYIPSSELSLSIKVII